MRPVADYSLYLVTDRALCLGRPLEDVVAQAVAGGASVVQLREKNLDSRHFLELARALKKLLSPQGVPLIINDRADIALASGADGLHVGQSDLTVTDARAILGPDAIIGLSVENREQVLEAANLDADYLAASPVFATPTKTDTAPPWGLEGLAWVRAHSRLPVVAIGGVNTGNAASLRRAGADGLAVVSALCSAPDTAAAARELRLAFV